jgi:Secretion system C-terminal sorting domain
MQQIPKMKTITIILQFTLIFTFSTSFGQNPDYIFESGYEGTTTLHQYNLNGIFSRENADITGADNGYDWELDLDNNPAIGDFRIYYEKGDTSRSIAQIIEEPGNPSNHVLSFSIRLPHIKYTNAQGDTLEKGRIQAAIKNNVNLTEFHFRQRLYIHPDFDLLKTTSYPIDWLTLQEFWNNEAKKSFPFRVTLNIQKKAGVGSQLYFGAHGQRRLSKGKWKAEWEAIDTLYPVPTGEWITMETWFKEGNAQTGRFKVIITDSKNQQHEIINITGFTHHPDDKKPDGVTSFNPMKLYTSGELINGMNAAKGCLCLYWDDFQIWQDSIPLGIEGQITKLPTIYPNPVGRTLYLRNIESSTNYQIFDYAGRVVSGMQTKLTNGIDVENLPAGIYFLKVYDRETNPVLKFVKQ